MTDSNARVCDEPFDRRTEPSDIASISDKQVTDRLSSATACGVNTVSKDVASVVGLTARSFLFP